MGKLNIQKKSEYTILILAISLIVVLFLIFSFSNTYNSKEIKKSPETILKQQDLRAVDEEILPQLNYIFGYINVKFKDGYDVVSKENAYNLVSQIKNKNSDLVDVLDVDKVFNAKPELKNYEIKKRIGLDRWVKIKISGDLDPVEEAKKWLLLPEVEQAEAIYESKPTLEEILEEGEEIPGGGGYNQIIPNDPLFERQWHHRNTGSNPNINPPGTPDADIDTPEAWYIERGNVIVGNPDTAVMWFHEDLVDNIWRNLGEDIDNDGDVLEWSAQQDRYIFDSGDANGIDDDNNGFADDFIGWDFEENDNDPYIPMVPGGPNWEHGTFTTGALAAKPNNGKGLAGVCWNCKVIATAGFYDIQETEYDIDNGAKVVSMSLYGGGGNLWIDLVNYASNLDVVLIASAGNFNLYVPPRNRLCVFDYVLCVAATNQSDMRKENSVFGELTDIAAPGSTYTTNNDPITKYSYHGGTSISAPIAAGTAALIRTINPSLSASEVVSIMQSAVNMIPDAKEFIGTGRINALKSINLAKTSLIYGYFPLALINDSNTKVTSHYLNIYGIAQTNNFNNYGLLIGEGIYPNSWDVLSESSTPGAGLLYSLDLSTLPFGIYQLKLVVTDTNGQEAFDTFPFKRTLLQKDNWPSIDNRFFHLSPTLADINNDLNQEIIIGQFFGRKIYVFEEDGNLLDGWPVILDDDVVSSAAVSDLTNDGDEEIIVNTEDNTYILNSDGSREVGWPRNFGHHITSFPVIANVDNDDDLEIVIGVYGEVHLVNYDGSSVMGWPQQVFPAGKINAPLVGDIDNDNKPEIIVGTSSGDVYAWNDDGTLISGWPQSTNDYIKTSPALSDVDGDGLFEIIVGSDEENPNNDQNLYVFHADGTLAIGFPMIDEEILASPALGDLNNDGVTEIVITTKDGQIYAIHGNGTILNGWPKDVDTDLFPQQLVEGLNENIISYSPILADIDYDGFLDIVIREHYFLDDYLIAFDKNGYRIDGWSLLPEEQVITSTPAIGDLDNDGLLEVVLGADYLYVWKIGQPIARELEWPEFRKDKENSGVIYITNKIKNPSFEVDTGIDFYPNWNDDDNIANNYLPDGYRTSRGGLLDGVVKYQGSKSLKLMTNNNRAYSYQDIPVEYNKRYRVSGYIKTDCIDNNCYGTILSECEKQDHTPIWDYNNCKLNINPISIRRLYGDNNWTYIEFDVENNRQDARFLRVLCYNTSGPLPLGTGTVWCDSFNVIEIPRGPIGSPLFLKEIPREGGFSE